MMLRIVFLLLLLSAPPAHAQFLGSASLGEPLTLELFPDTPEPGESVRATLGSQSIDLDRSLIVWSVNGARRAEDDGQKSILVVAPPLGSSVTLTAQVESATLPQASITRTLRPGEVDLVWEAGSYTPPLYRGKSLASPASSVRVEAFPRIIGANGARIPNNSLIFTWRKNGALVGSASGRGKSRATFPAPLLFGSDTISLEVTSLDETRIARKDVRISSTDPFVVLYHDHPLLGMTLFNATVNATGVSDIEATFAAVPYFSIATSPGDSEFSYLWEVNGVSVPADPNDPHRITLNGEGSSGEARLALTLSHARDWFMSVRETWNIVLNAGRGASQNSPFTNSPFAQ